MVNGKLSHTSQRQAVCLSFDTPRRIVSTMDPSIRYGTRRVEKTFLRKESNLKPYYNLSRSYAIHKAFTLHFEKKNLIFPENCFFNPSNNRSKQLSYQHVNITIPIKTKD